MYSDGNSYEQILARALSDPLLANFDRREGSVIYNALAPLCLELANAYLAMDIMDEESYLLTATGTNLDKRVSDSGIVRISATKAKRKGKFQKKVDNEYVDMDIPVGSRFGITNDSTITYIYIGKEGSENILECEQTGTKGNSYVGTILPLQYIVDLSVAEIIDYVPYYPARDEETDDELRERALSIINSDAFGGNIDDYINFITSIEGVGSVKIYPAWKGGGYVLASVVDTDYEPISSEFISQIKEIVDPEEFTGQGYGTAPIGHFVTITTPEKSNISISFKVMLEEGLEVPNVEEAIEEKIQEYFSSERRKFGQDTDSLAIYRARIIAAIFEVSGVTNVLDLTLNGEDKDIILSDNIETDHGATVKITQYLPYTSADIITITKSEG